MHALRIANLGVRFTLEVASLVALAVWGFGATDGIARWVLGLAAPAAAAMAWGLFVSPKAAVRAPMAVRLLVEACVFGAAACALRADGRASLGVAFALVAVASSTVHHWPRPAQSRRAEGK